jgi:hypothetical protein
MLKGIIKFMVDLGTSTTVSYVTKSLQDRFVPKKTGLAGTCRDASLFAARTAITFKAIDVMDNYVDRSYDATADACKKMLNAISEIGESTKTKAKSIDISTKTEEDSDNGEANTKDSTETSNN